MKSMLFSLGCFFLVWCSYCSSQKATFSPQIKQGISGYIKRISGNQMPSPDIKPAQPKGIKATVYVYEITNINQVARSGTSPFYESVYTKFVMSVESDSTGYFSAELPAGQYSLFTKVNGKLYANSFDQYNNINPGEVKKDKLTQMDIIISAGAIY